MQHFVFHPKKIFLSIKINPDHCEFVHSSSLFIPFLTFDLQSTLEPLPSVGSSVLSTNLSRLISFTWLDHRGNAIPLLTDVDHPFEIVIPRDPSLIIPPMSLVNVIGQRGFHFYSLDLTPFSSIHFDIHPLNINLSYVFIYRFDRAPILNSSQPQIDGWTIFFPSSKTHLSLPLSEVSSLVADLSNESLFTSFLDNEQTSNHRSLIFALRQWNDSSLSSPLINDGVLFIADYQLRLYTSSCFYWDETTEEWKCDGMKVGPQTNHFQTQCLSTHV